MIAHQVDARDAIDLAQNVFTSLILYPRVHRKLHTQPTLGRRLGSNGNALGALVSNASEPRRSVPGALAVPAVLEKPLGVLTIWKGFLDTHLVTRPDPIPLPHGSRRPIYLQMKN